MSHNVHRRHLTVQQRGAIAAELATMKSGARTDLAPNDARSPALSDAQAAKVMRVSERTVERAKTRMRTDRAAHEKAKAGTLGRAKPTKSQRKLRQHLGDQRAEAFIERHQELSELDGIANLRPADTAKVVDIEWLQSGPISDVAEWMLHVLGRDRLDDLLAALA